jgi:tRNA uridine 5-carboxymethylaminomethyl modification enzyme
LVNGYLEARGTSAIPEPTALAKLVKRPEVRLLDLVGQLGAISREESPDPDALAATEMEIKYAGYISRERARAERLQRQADFQLPVDLPYLELTSLSTEARQKLDRIRPLTLAQASRIPGVAPSDLQNLMMEVRKLQR